MLIYFEFRIFHKENCWIVNKITLEEDVFLPKFEIALCEGFDLKYVANIDFLDENENLEN